MNKREPYNDYLTAESFATEAINAVKPEFSTNFLKVLEFCFKYPEDVSGLHSSTPKLSGAWIEKKAESYVNQRHTTKPSLTSNLADPLIATISEEYFGIAPEKIDGLLKHHKIAMAAENVTGNLLEEYIATIMEPLGWIWCSGTMIKGTDFIRFPTESTGKPILLQIKNRSNSENSSSSSIRVGTTIEKWYRLEAETGNTRWNLFPDVKGIKLLSEEKFREFAISRITEWKS